MLPSNGSSRTAYSSYDPIVTCEYCTKRNKASDLECQGCGATLPIALPIAQPAQLDEQAIAVAAPAIEAVRPARQPSGCASLFYFLLIGWWVSLYWACIGLMMLLTVIGAPIGVAFFKTTRNVAFLRSGPETIGVTFKRHWQIGKS